MLRCEARQPISSTATTLNAVAVHRIADGKATTTATVVVPDALVFR